MGKNRKRGRCVRKNIHSNNEPEELVQAPHSFVIHKGLSGGHILELTKDFRKVMEPFTASSLKIHDFSLARDVVSSLKKQIVVEEAFKHSPLIVLNSFSGEGLQMKLMASMFQNMFPSINLTNVVPVGISKGVKKVVQGKVPNLSRCNDISEFFSKSALLSESEAEDDPQNHVTLPQKIASRGNIESEKSAIRLSELGPRLKLQLVKIEDGLLDGEVLYHDLIQKTEEEKADIQKRRT
ncbi:hypothetical protein NQ317_019882 [Molorchus minor]|uniref:Brix domain-containing protein n=1 Tax=Molorchus minor TaxID=1323400 RepID=A0ABQ9J903_9CUCU|nr:hypothetical protein NQ317_019882 [Molorchus minor]